MTPVICVTCGTQFTLSDTPPERCPICDDERQYIPPEGQKWTTLDEYRTTHHNVVAEEENNLYTIHPQPKAGIGQHAFLIRTEKGNLLWDCVPPLDDATLEKVQGLGGIAGIAVSHPHFHTTMVEWSHAFGGVPVYIHARSTEWVMRPDAVITYWEGEIHELFGGLTLARVGGHFAGSQVLHWPGGAHGKGVTLSGDMPYVCQDRRWVSFMYSYPNLLPLGPSAVRKVVASLEPLTFDRLYGAFPGQVIQSDAKAAVVRSAERYLKQIEE